MSARLHSFYSSAKRQFFSPNQNATHSAFGASNRAKTIFFTKAIIGSSLAGIAISEFILTEERIFNMAKAAEKMGLNLESIPFLGTAHAFSTAAHGLHPPHFPWEFEKFYKTFDHAAIRRGYQVYREVCSACHSMDYIYWRNLVGVSHTEQEAKDMAAEYEYKDGPDETGEYFMRPGKLSDQMPKSYQNEEAARAANAGALPPDLSCISRARHGEMNYLFSLLTGYTEPPAGVQIRDGLYYNRFFHGGAIAMAQAIYDESVEYEDGTPNNASQISKDVSEFLHWASYPEMDERKVLGIKTMLVTSVLLGFSIWWKRFKWSYIKSRQIVFKPQKFKDV